MIKTVSYKPNSTLTHHAGLEINTANLMILFNKEKFKMGKLTGAETMPRLHIFVRNMAGGDCGRTEELYGNFMGFSTARTV